MHLEGTLKGTVLALALGAGVALSNPLAAVTAAWGTPPAGGWPRSTAHQDFAIPVGTYDDAIGDAFGLLTPNLDLSSIQASFDTTNLTITLNFATPISPSDSGQPNALVGLIDIDADQNTSTGNGGAVNVFCPAPTAIGVDYEVDIEYDSGTGLVPVVDSAFNLVGYAPATFTSNSFTVSVPLSILGPDDGSANVATVIGTIPEPTDCAPDGNVLASINNVSGIPTLGAGGLAALAAAIAVAALALLRRRA